MVDRLKVSLKYTNSFFSKQMTVVDRALNMCKMIFWVQININREKSSWTSGVSWGVHSVRLHPGGSKRGAKKEGRKRKKQGKGEKKRERKGAPKKDRREGKENMQKKRKRGKKSKENRI